MPSPQDRRARAATTAVFFVTGFVVAAWATRIPAVQQHLGLSPGGLAVAVLGLEGGALVGLPAGAALVARLGSRASLRLAELPGFDQARRGGGAARQTRTAARLPGCW